MGGRISASPSSEPCWPVPVHNISGRLDFHLVREDESPISTQRSSRFYVHYCNYLGDKVRPHRRNICLCHLDAVGGRAQSTSGWKVHRLDGFEHSYERCPYWLDVWRNGPCRVYGGCVSVENLSARDPAF